MNRHKVVSDIVHIPRDYKLNNVSIYTLLKESGYFEVYSFVSIKDIRTFLTSEPKSFEDWLDYSRDKRCNSGWYFTRIENKYVVGYYPSQNKSYLLEDPLDACAVFIKEEIESIRLAG